ncbi:sensor histidine kinase [Halobacterium jilantaiense]|uniref:histidine kinase n=1 Tax=Halobacterium jilantaiense TaxID=355548 RepID=A0A1I0PM83_9EURY|nr:histidine kinase N-terminal 7TM domain-containing protein [Halobacterium jilantaiense]SEW15527.1 Signal transduction histidine kinase [Halobacterium jilantaiense]
MQLTAEVALSGLSAVASLAVAWFAHRRDAPGSRSVIVFSTVAGLWAATNAAQILATTLDAKLLADRAQYVGIAVFPGAWFTFTAAYSGRENWVTPRTVAALAVVPVLTLGALATGVVDFVVAAGLDTANGLVVLDHEFGVGFWILIAYAVAVSGAGTVFLVESALRVGHRYRRQAVVLLTGAVVPWVAMVVFLGGARFEPEALFGVPSLAFGYGVARYGLLETKPVDRDRVFSELNDGVVVLGSDGQVVDYNPAGEELLGTTLAVGEAFERVAPAAVADSVETETTEPVLVEQDSVSRWVTVETTGERDESARTVVLLNDVTELERQRAELDKENARLERVADTISHDLRNPLSVADGYLDLAAETGEQAHFDRIESAHDRMDDIIDGTLRLARAGTEAPETETVSVRSVAERAWGNVESTDASLDCTTAAPVVADPRQLESLLENLFRNAIEHSDGTASVTVDSLDDGFIVADDGPGIPEAERETVFDRGYTTNDDGTGFGLAIIRDIADAHGWQVSLSESPDGGLQVSVTGVRTAHGEGGESETARGTD